MFQRPYIPTSVVVPRAVVCPRRRLNEVHGLTVGDVILQLELDQGEDLEWDEGVDERLAAVAASGEYHFNVFFRFAQNKSLV